MKVRLTVEVSDNFEKGNCYDCPFAEMREDGRGGYFYNCPTMKRNECPIEVVEE